ncbi:ABC transporter ATP-binding protein/permease [Ruminococcaceae bacterium OttesenSCG-928-I18]|nr:ABC transporter ATP-binding protein/permease [Ruminococcaceae bacterium OttesenSCG-928-I18]
MLKKAFRLSDEGSKSLNRAIVACVISNITLLFPFAIVLMILLTLLEPLMGGGPLDTSRLWLWTGLGVLAAVLYGVAYGVEYDKTYTAAYKECESLRVDVAERMRRLPLSFFNRKDLAELTTNIMGDCATIEHCMSHIVPSMIANCVTISLTCLLLAVYDWRMSLAMFCTFPLSLLLIFGSRSIQRRFSERHMKAKLEASTQMQEYLEGIKVVKAFGLEGEKSRALKNSFDVMKKESIYLEAVIGAFVLPAQMLLRVASGMVVLVGVYLFTGGSLGVIPLLTFLLISLRIYGPVTTLLTLAPEFFHMQISAKRMQTLRREPEMSGQNHVELEDCNVALHEVSFGYNEAEVIHNLTVDIPQNGVTALVGPSGSGKSTVSRLIARFWDTDFGDITIGGKRIKEVDPEQLMKYMSFVFQDVVLFNDTVANNIRLGRQNATDEEVLRVAKLARCDEFVQTLPQGYDTVIGENGCTISGGERQRISIARALLKDAPIVLLDEATASLDPENEVLIQEAINELVKGRTVIVIAHRLRTVAGADKIVVLDEGKVVEMGTGEELLQKNGLFARLYNIQQESFGWSVGA